MKPTSPTFCMHPWTSIDINNKGILSPCCKYQERLDPLWKEHKLETHTIEEFQNSEWMTNLKTRLLNGEKPESCNRCWVEESSKLESLRQIDQKRYGSDIDLDLFDYDNPEIKILNVQLGNLCNIKCRSCHPRSSSTWIKEWNDIYGEKFPHNQFYKDRTAWEQILNKATGLIRLQISGGEPFLTEIHEHKEILQTIVSSGSANQMTLEYHTNCTIFPDEEIWSMWSHFKSVLVNLSLDGIGRHLEYTRFPAKWDIVSENVIRYSKKQQEIENFNTAIGTVVSAYTIYYLDNILDFAEEHNLKGTYFNRLNWPSYMKCSIFPDPVRQAIAKKLLQSKRIEVKKCAQYVLDEAFDSKLFATFIKQNQLHDNYRNIHFNNVFPELAELIRNYS